MNWKRSQDSSVKAALAGVRNDLLDLSMGNPLINYRPNKLRGIFRLPISASDIYQHLVGRRGYVSFTTEDSSLRPDFAGSKRFIGGEQPLIERPYDFREQFHPENLVVTLAMKKPELDSRLLATYYAAQASIEEEGAVTLFLSLGILQWAAEKHKDEEFCAPLIMIPVKLDRASISSGFRLSYSGDGLSLNACLVEMLRRNNISLPALPETLDLKLTEYLVALRKAVAQHGELSINTDIISIALFSFSKFLMYKDLDLAQWSKQAILHNDYLCRLLTGAALTPVQPPLPEDILLEHTGQKPLLEHVVDADSSQARAIVDVGRGESIVIQGPPGTGKSQTIVNIIADSVARGKTVLFVSEKNAAVEVVKNRLEAIGLGQALLGLHSNRASRRSVFDQLRATLDLRGVPKTDLVPDIQGLNDAESRLNTYCSIINTPCFPTNETPYMIYGGLSRLKEKLKQVSFPQLDLTEACTWTVGDIQAQRNYIGRMQAALATCSVPISNPFWGVTNTVMSAINRDRLRQLLEEAREAVGTLHAKASNLANTLDADPPRTIEEVLDQVDTSNLLLDAPPLHHINLNSEVWVFSSTLIQECLIDGEEYTELVGKWSSVVTAEAWSKDLTVLIDAVKQLKGKWWTGRSGMEKSLAAQVDSLLVRPRGTLSDNTLEMLLELDRAQRLGRRIDARTSIVSRAFGSNWHGVSSDWTLLRSQAAWIHKMIARVGTDELPSWLAPINKAGFNRSALLEDIQSVKWAYANYVSAQNAALSMLVGENSSSSLAIIARAGQTLNSLTIAYTELHSRIHELGALSRYLQVRAECSEHIDLKIINVADRWKDAQTHLADLFELSRLTSLLEHVFMLHPSLNYFDGPGHSDAVEQFRTLDKLSLLWSRSRIAGVHMESIRTSATHRQAFDWMVSMSESNQGLPSIRKLISQNAKALQVLKPVFMMSPNSVATFLPPEEIQFDIVIFDEASQLRPVDALGSIARAKQIVIVGDSKQLPPTNYFVGNQIRDDEEGEQSLEKFESILGLACSRGARQHLLRWHYRSRHESLIAQSNVSFYDNQLIVFPSPDRRRIGGGLVYQHVSTDELDNPSGLSAQQLEAHMVAETVMERVAEQMNDVTSTKLSFGVATLNTRQRDMVLEELEALRNERPEYEDFFTTSQHEPFFVKNLENIQGDERDVIYISLGCGDGLGTPVPTGLGPLLREGGERKLNVLFTRARRRCEVFTTLRSADILITEQSPAGLATFKNFLQYAEHGRIRRPIMKAQQAPSVFESQVAQVIERSGFTVQRNIGPSGLLLDLAVVDPQVPERYLLGVLCDGPSYSEPRSCRDRDRLREATLIDMGWTIYRVWSTAWVQNRSQEEGKLLAALSDAAKRKEDVSANPNMLTYP